MYDLQARTQEKVNKAGGEEWGIGRGGKESPSYGGIREEEEEEADAQMSDEDKNWLNESTKLGRRYGLELILDTEVG